MHNRIARTVPMLRLNMDTICRFLRQIVMCMALLRFFSLSISLCVKTKLCRSKRPTDQRVEWLKCHIVDSVMY